MTLYVLSTDNSGYYKVGHTENWPERLRMYRSHARKVEVHFVEHRAGRLEEQALHYHLRSRLEPRDDHRTEWFALERIEVEHFEKVLEAAKVELTERITLMEEAAATSLRSLGLLPDESL